MEQIIFNNGHIYEVAPYPVEKELPVISKRCNIDGIKCEVLRITVYATYQQVVEDFIDGAIFSIRSDESVPEYDNEGNVINVKNTTVDYDKSNYSIASDIIDHRNGTITVYMVEPSKYDIMQSNIEQLKTELPSYPELMKKFPAIYPKWEMKFHEKDSIVSHDGKLYQCRQSHTSTGDPSHTPPITPALWLAL